MKVIIIEDEVLLSKELERYLNSIDSSIDVIAKLTSVKASIDWLNNHKCDLIFTDIELSDGLSFSIFSETRTEIPIIFTTAYNKYAVQAFDLNSIGYLLKPFEKEDVKKVLEKYKKSQLQYSQLLNVINHLNVSKDNSNSLNRIILSMGNVQKPVLVEDVAFFMADDRYLFAFLEDQRKYYYDSTLSNLENELDTNIFFRVNRRFIVNKKFVNEIVTISNSRLEIQMKVDAPEKIIVSYSKGNEFKKWIVK